MWRGKYATGVALGCLMLTLAGCGADSSSSSGSTPSASSSTQDLSIQGSAAPTVPVGTQYTMQVRVTAPSGAAIGYAIQNKPTWANFDIATGSLQGRPGPADLGSYVGITISASDGSDTASLPPFSVTVTPGGSSSGSVARPAYSTGDGFFVLNGQLYDPNGDPFRIRGVNRLHWDSNSATGIALSGANTVRTFIDFSQPPANNVQLIQTQNLDNDEVPVVTYAGTGSGETLTSCSTDPNVFNAALSAWTSQASSWTTLNQYLIINVANEWGPADSTAWESTYISAIGRLRAAGYTGPILIDSGACGQDDADLLQYSQAVFNSDPERNVIFSIHMYGSANDYSASVQSVQKGNPTVITLASDSPTHPFAASFNGSGNGYSGIAAYQISGVQGMTELNGEQPAASTVGGSPGAWTITLNVDSTNWPDYSGGGTAVDYNGNYALRLARFAALAQSTGAVYVVGEFGPGNDIGPSPTMVTPGEIITAAEADGIGWMPWAWDDNDRPNCTGDNNWFDMTYNCGAYTQPSDLTTYGQDVVLNPTYGIAALAQRATGF